MTTAISAKRPPRLLVVTYHFTPDGAVGGLRWSGMSKNLARRGWEVHIITAAEQRERAAEPGVFVHVCRPRRTLNDSYNAWATRVRSKRAAAAASLATGSNEASARAAPLVSGPHRNGMIARLRAIIGSALSAPDYSRGWILSAAKMSRDLLREQAFDVVITSGPPHGAHFAGALACFGRREALWVDLRDPWIRWRDDNGRLTPWKASFTGWCIAQAEQALYKQARGVVTNTADFAAKLRIEHPRARIAHVPNGVDRDRLPPAAMDKFDGLSITYAGTLYLERDLSPVLHALRDFLDKNPASRASLKLRIAGSMDPANEAEFWHEVDAGGLRDIVDVRGPVPGPDALALINRSHLTLVLAQNQPVQVPAKLYECAAMGVSTLVIGELTSASAREARRIGALVREPTDVNGIREIIENLWQDPNRVFEPAAEIGYDAIAGQMDSLLHSGLGVRETPASAEPGHPRHIPTH